MNHTDSRATPYRRKKPALKPLVAILFFLAGITVCAFDGIAEQVYKWIDEHGGVHYSQTRPTGADETRELSLDPGVDEKTIDEAVQRLQHLEDKLKSYAENRRKKETMKIEEQKEERRLAEECEQLQRRLQQQTQPYTLQFRLDDEGNRRFLSEAETEESIRRLEAGIREKCR